MTSYQGLHYLEFARKIGDPAPSIQIIVKLIMSIQEGKTAPAFTLMDQNGNKVSLKNYIGIDVIVYFYPKDDTPGCTKEACGFRDLWADIEKAGAVVFGVSPDNAESHIHFIDKYNLPLTLLSDPDKKMMTKYRAYGEKMMYGKKIIEIIRSTVWIGDKARQIQGKLTHLSIPICGQVNKINECNA